MPTARKVFSVLLLLVIVTGALVVTNAPTAVAGGGVTPQPNCKKNCLPYFYGNNFLCVYAGCDLATGECYYDCYWI